MPAKPQGKPGPITLSAARGEYEPVQVVLRAEKDAELLSAEVSPLRQRWRRTAPIAVRAGANVLVAGSAIFAREDPLAAAAALCAAAGRVAAYAAPRYATPAWTPGCRGRLPPRISDLSPSSTAAFTFRSRR